MTSPIPTVQRALAACLLFGLLLVAAPPASAQDPGTEQDQVDQIMAGLTGPETPGGVVAVIRGGRVAFQRAYGMANLTHDIPFSVETRTNIGSTSKQFTAFALALLAERGQLSLDDDVRAHVPELPDLGETVTLRHLLTHTSGYREFLNTLAIGGWRLDEADHIGREEIVTVVQRQPTLQNSPGAEFNYNNTGYALAAMVVERVTGEPFPAWMQTHVFEPLGMTATVVRATPREIVPNSAQGYGPHGDGGGFREFRDIGAAMGAGGIYTTVADLALWMGNLRTAELGGREVIRRMTTPNVLTTGDTTEYGLGLMMSQTRGLRTIHHGGADAAHRSHFAYYPDLDAGLVVLSNNAAFDGSIPGRIADVFFGDRMEPREETPEPPAVLPTTFDPDSYDPASFDIYVGRYELAVQPGFILTFRREGDRLIGQATGQPAFPLTPTSDSTFTIAAVQASVTFHTDESGQVTGLTLHQNGNHAARRLPAEVDLTPFEGRYYSDELETSYTATVEDGRLVLRHRRGGAITLAHVSGDSFAGRAPLTQVEFDRDDAGNVSAFRASFVRARDIVFERVQ
jgi:CubicO group peptidase (beta-lactamase class C family)